MDREEVVRRLHNAYRALIERDDQLLGLDVNERSITHKFAEHLQKEFPEWDVDCEYNRHGRDPKRLRMPASAAPDDTNAVTVFPDVIVHRRGTNENLVVIEAKKVGVAGGDYDDQKLEAFMHDLGYAFAFKLLVPVGGSATAAGASKDIIQFRPCGGEGRVNG